MRSCRRLAEPVIATLIFGALSCVAQAAQTQKNDRLYTATHEQLEAVKIVVAQENAWNNGNLDGFLSVFKDDSETEAMLGSGVKGLANIRSAYHINFPNREAMGVIAYSDVEARELGEKYAMTTGRYHLERSKKGGGSADGTFTEVMEKTAQGWQVIFSETT